MTEAFTSKLFAPRRHNLDEIEQMHLAALKTESDANVRRARIQRFYCTAMVEVKKPPVKWKKKAKRRFGSGKAI